MKTEQIKNIKVEYKIYSHVMSNDHGRSEKTIGELQESGWNITVRHVERLELGEVVRISSPNGRNQLCIFK